MCMPKGFRWAALLIVCIAIISIILLFISPFQQNVNVDWTMNGTMITADGRIGETMVFTVAGTIRNNSDDNDKLVLNFALPNTFRYVYNTSSSDDISTMRQYANLPYYISLGYDYDKVTNSPVFRRYALNLEDEFMIMVWDRDNYYMVASRDPNVDPRTILYSFQSFLDLLVDSPS